MEAWLEFLYRYSVSHAEFMCQMYFDHCNHPVNEGIGMIARFVDKEASLSYRDLYSMIGEINSAIEKYAPGV